MHNCVLSQYTLAVSPFCLFLGVSFLSCTVQSAHLDIFFVLGLSPPILMRILCDYYPFRPLIRHLGRLFLLVVISFRTFYNSFCTFYNFSENYGCPWYVLHISLFPHLCWFSFCFICLLPVQVCTVSLPF